MLSRSCLVNSMLNCKLSDEKNFSFHHNWRLVEYVIIFGQFVSLVVLPIAATLDALGGNEIGIQSNWHFY